MRRLLVFGPSIPPSNLERPDFQHLHEIVRGGAMTGPGPWDDLAGGTPRPSHSGASTAWRSIRSRSGRASSATISDYLHLLYAVRVAFCCVGRGGVSLFGGGGAGRPASFRSSRSFFSDLYLSTPVLRRDRREASRGVSSAAVLSSVCNPASRRSGGGRQLPPLPLYARRRRVGDDHVKRAKDPRTATPRSASPWTRPCTAFATRPSPALRQAWAHAGQRPRVQAASTGTRT